MAVPNKLHFQRTSGARSWVDTMYRYGNPNGDVIYVHNSGAGGTTGGRSPEEAVTTIDAAINLCTANHGDVIVVMEFHTEALGAAAAIALDVADVRVVGMGRGRQRPILTYTATGSSCDISAAKCSIENIVFSGIGVDAATAMINVSAADAQIIDCEIETGDATNQATLGILTTAGADRLRIQGCHIHGLVNAGTTSQISLVGGDSIVIKDNIIIGACGTTGNIAQATTLCSNIVIWGNVMLNQTADANNKNLVFGSTSTGVVAFNGFGVIDSSSPTPWTAAGLWFFGNYYVGAADTTSILR